MYRVAICEDDQLSRENLCTMCGEILRELDVSHSVAAFSSGEELEARMASGTEFDLLCLDIIMDGKSGMELAQELRLWNDRVSIIFITSSQEFLKDGYKVRPVQYLIKPVDREELKQAIITDLRLNHRPESVSIRTGAGITVLPLDELLYVESRDHLSVAKLQSGEQTFRMRLSDMERLLPGDRFCRCHNSYLVNMQLISKISRNGIELSNGQWLPVGRSYYRAAQEKLIRFFNRA